MAIEIRKVESSALAGVGYDPEEEKLHVQFNSGHIHEYGDVTQAEYDALMAAGSKGAHFGKEVRPKHDGVRITGKCVCGDIGPLGEPCSDCGVSRYVA